MSRLQVRQQRFDWISIWALLFGFTLLLFGSAWSLVCFGASISLFIIRSNDRESAFMAVLFTLAIIGVVAGSYSLLISRYLSMAAL